MWFATLFLILSLLYVIVPWDLDFVPVLGRLDDLAIFLLALFYYWKRKKMREAMGMGGRIGGESARAGEGHHGRPKEEGETDPYRTLGVSPGDDEETIKRAYREMLGRYHPDRVQHLGEEFREMAARRTRAITGAWRRIREERRFS